MFMTIGLLINIFMAFFVYRYFFLRFSLFNHQAKLMRFLRVLCLVMAFSLPLSFLFGRAYYIPPLAFLFNSLFGLNFLLFVSALPIFIFLPIFVRLPNRLRLLIEKSEAYYLALSLFFIISSFALGLLPPTTSQTKVSIKNFPIEQYKIVQLSDMHLGPILREGFVRQVVERVNALNPDLIVITGDLVDQKTADLSRPLSLLAELKAKNGVYFCLGNHEYYAQDIENLLAKLRTIGIIPLVNEGVLIGEGERRFNLVGIADKMGERFPTFKPNLEKAFATQDLRYPTIFLSHHPVNPETLKYPADLVLSGHTHGGQVLPFDIPVKLVHKFLEGLYHIGDKQLYVHRGTGFWGPPMRFPQGGEIAEILLTQRPIP